MSRIGKRPISIPSKVTIAIEGSHISVKGLKVNFRVYCQRRSPSNSQEKPGSGRMNPLIRQLHGLSRTLVANMVEGLAGFPDSSRNSGLDTGAGSRSQPEFECRV